LNVSAAPTAGGGEATRIDGGALVPCTLREYAAYFLRLGTVGFGGPIALAGYMQRDLVEERRWITKQDYVEGLALAQLAPGPLAAQLAIYLGWVRGGVLGGTLIGFAFVLPSFLMVLALSAVYVRFGGISWIRGAFYGIGAAVIAIILRSVVKLVKMTLASDRLLWAVFILNAGLTAWTESEVVWVFAASGVIATIVKARGKGGANAAILGVSPLPLWLISGLHGAATVSTVGKILWFFAEAGAFVFGSGLAIVPFLYGGVVAQHHWLTDRQFLDAVAVAMITPGPVVITVAFIGYLVAGPLGSVAAAIGTFLPCYLFTVLPAPYFRRYSRNPTIKAFVSGVSAAATGAIAGAAFVLGKRALIDVPSWLIFGATLALISKVKKAPEPLVILAAGAVGLVLRSLMGPT
jgi:chromate transporter